MRKISIIGSGVAGLWCGFLLSQKDFEVHIYERQDHTLSEACSYRAGGMLAPYCEAENAEPLITSLGVRSIALWKEYFPDETFINGSLLLSHPRDGNMLRHFEDMTENYHICDKAAISKLEPDLSGRFEKGLFYPDEGHIAPRKLLPRMIEACRKNNVTFHFCSEYEQDHSDYLIDTRGLWAKDAQPLRGVKGEMVIIRCKDITLKRPVRLLHLRHPLYIVPRADHHYMIGATTIETETVTHNVSLRSAGELLTQAYHLHPAFGEAEIIEFNTGLRPAYEDNLPRIVTDGHKFYLNGLYRHGWTIAPALAEQLVDKIIEP
ncbi:MAG: FAD-dependent oxidoreductase [Pseudomonadota bacterium]